MKYEIYYLVGASQEADLEKIRSEVKNIIAAEGGIFEEKEISEKRKLAYKVKHETHGIYVACRFELEDPEKSEAIVKKLNLYPGILRYVISRTEDLPELLSKEERIEKAPVMKTRQEKAPIKKETAKSEPAKEKPATEDIDKKLEEILNI